MQHEASRRLLSQIENAGRLGGGLDHLVAVAARQSLVERGVVVRQTERLRLDAQAEFSECRRRQRPVEPAAHERQHVEPVGQLLAGQPLEHRSPGAVRIRVVAKTRRPAVPVHLGHLHPEPFQQPVGQPRWRRRLR